MRKVINSDLAGKTIKSVDASCTNVLTLSFTDGTELKLWAEVAVHTRAGVIPGIFVDGKETT